MLKRKRPRPLLNRLDRFFWTTLRTLWSRWADVLVIVKPETVIGWHRAAFRLYWRWRSWPRSGRPKISEEIRVLVRRMAEENSDWGAPRIHGELLKLGFVISERTIARYLRRIHRRRDIEHGRRKILHFNVTRHPNSDWVLQQLRETFPEAAPYRYVILDRDSKFDDEVITFLKATGLKPKRTSIQAPWQNGLAERWIGSCRRELLEHVIALNESHLRRLVREYVAYHHEDRIHDSLAKDTPHRRPAEPRPAANAAVISMPRLGGPCTIVTSGGKQHKYRGGGVSLLCRRVGNTGRNASEPRVLLPASPATQSQPLPGSLPYAIRSKSFLFDRAFISPVSECRATPWSR